MSDDTFVVRYEIEDGYGGKSRPQSFNFDASCLNPDMTDQQIVNALYEQAHDDMMQIVNPVVENSDEFMAWAHEQVAKLREEAKS